MQIPWKTHVQEFLYSKVAAFKPATLLKNQIFHSYFSITLPRFSEHFFLRTAVDGCLRYSEIIISFSNWLISYT